MNADHSNFEQLADQWVHREKIKILFSNFHLSWVLSLLVATVFAYLAIDVGRYALGMGWWLVFCFIIMLRLRLVVLFYRADIALDEYDAWARRYLFLALLAGIGWGAGGLLIGPQLSPVDQAFLLLILIGVSGGSVPLLGIHKQTLFAFVVPTVIPYMVWVAFSLSDKLALMLMIMVLYLISIAVAIARLDENMSDSLRLKYQLEQRTEKLQDANEKLEHLTLVDSLTQLYNRRFFERQMEKEWKKCHRESKHLALLVIDIDYFKLYNDSYGHAAGDECLKKVASALTRALNRPGDMIARIGGEEFVALLPGIDEEGAIKVAETMQQKLQLAQIEHRTSPIDDYVTVSIGLAVTYPAENASALGLFKAADKALYRGKFMGRNHIVVGELDMLDA